VSSRCTLTQDEATLNQPARRLTPSPRASRKKNSVEVDTLAAGDVPGVSIELRDVIHMALNTTIVIPQGAVSSRIIAHVKYPLNVMNLRLALYGANQSNALVEGYGSPLKSSDGTFQGQALLMVPLSKTLQPGVYYLMTLVSNVLPLHRNQIYCLPMDWRLDLSALELPSGSGRTPRSPAPTARKRPSLVDVIPRSVEGLDRSDSLSITFVLSVEAAMAMSSSSHFATLQRVDDGTFQLPSSQYFTDTNTFTVVFSGSTLQWGTVYRLTLDGSRLQSAATGETYDVSAFDATDGTELTYSTATCGCLGGFCVPGGGCQCTEPSGEYCSLCSAGFQLSQHAVDVGVGSLHTRRRICEPIPSTTPAPHRRITPAPFHPTAAPSHTSHPRTAAPPTPVPPAPTTEEANKGQQTDGTDSARPPLRSLRYALAYAAVALLLLYTLTFVFRYRNLVRRNIVNRNPFRTGTGVNDVDEHDIRGSNHHEADRMMHGVRVFGANTAAATLSEEDDD